MLAIPSRHRSLWLLVAMVVAQLLLLAVQIRRERDVRLIRVWAVAAITPFQRAGSWMVDGVSSAWNSYVDLRGTRKENAELRSQNDAMKRRIWELESRAAEADRYRALLDFKGSSSLGELLPARVIGSSPVASSHVILIDRGSDHGIRRDMPVLTPDGVVGKVTEVFSNTSQVQVLTDKDSGVGALLVDSRTQGIIKGTGDPRPTLNYVVNQQKVAPGERILTSGLDRVFPKDLPLGAVIRAEPGNPFQVIAVEPAAHLDRLEEVLVLLELKPALPAAAVKFERPSPSSSKLAAETPRQSSPSHGQSKPPEKKTEERPAPSSQTQKPPGKDASPPTSPPQPTPSGSNSP